MKQIKLCIGRSSIDVQYKVNEFLLTLKPGAVIDIKLSERGLDFVVMIIYIKTDELP